MIKEMFPSARISNLSLAKASKCTVGEVVTLLSAGHCSNVPPTHHTAAKWVQGLPPGDTT